MPTINGTKSAAQYCLFDQLPLITTRLVCETHLPFSDRIQGCPKGSPKPPPFYPQNKPLFNLDEPCPKGVLSRSTAYIQEQGQELRQ